MMEIRKERQINPIADDVLAITAIIRPILTGVLYAISSDKIREVGDYNGIKLKMLPRMYRPGDGDVGICFEYAVHDALSNGDDRVSERISDALKLCNLRGVDPKSILFGVEKSGSLQLIDTAKGVLTDDSRALTGGVGQPPKLKKRLNQLVSAFRRPSTRTGLPYSINGLWKADLFVGSTATQQWVGTSVKVNPSHLEGAAGLRIGIVPTKQGNTDRVRRDDRKNLVICPLHHDADFMQAFYEAWRIVQAFLHEDGRMPKEVVLPNPVHREICRILVERIEYPVIDVIDALRYFAQPELLDNSNEKVDLVDINGSSSMDMVISPISRS